VWGISRIYEDISKLKSYVKLVEYSVVNIICIWGDELNDY